MSILLMLIPLGLLLVGVAAWAFAWAVRRGSEHTEIGGERQV